jgi:DNA-binding protein HU-beta
MNKKELVYRVAERAQIQVRDAEVAVNALIDVIADALVNDELTSLMGFGTFSIRQRSARIGRNPATGAEIAIAATRVPAFKPGKSLRDRIAASAPKLAEQ